MPLYDVIRAAASWILVVEAVLLLVTDVPSLSLFLPNLLYGENGGFFNYLYTNEYLINAIGFNASESVTGLTLNDNLFATSSGILLLQYIYNLK